MKKIDYLESLNITFNKINIAMANEIIEHEFPCSIILSYTSLYDKYRTKDLKDKFVNLDFSCLYYLAKINEEFQKFILLTCIELEQKLKTIFISDAEKLDSEKDFLKEYLKSDYEFLSKANIKDFDSFINNIDNDSLSLDKFINLFLYSSFEKMLYSFYEKNAIDIYNKKRAPFEKYLPSLRRLRNLAAHNQPLINQLCETKAIPKNSLSPFLSNKGIKAKTLHTNLSKPIMFDFCMLLRLYCGLMPIQKIKLMYKNFKKILLKSNIKYGRYLKSNQTLVSSYNFIKKIAKIFSKEVSL